MNEINKLNERQQLVIDTNMPILNIAGPGSGKTKTMIEKILSIVKKEEDINNLMIVTFTNNAANEITKRINEKLNININSKKYFLGTFHSLFYKIINENHKAMTQFGFKKKQFTILKPSDDTSIFTFILKSELYEKPQDIKNKDFVKDIENLYKRTPLDLYYLISSSINKAPKHINEILENIEKELNAETNDKNIFLLKEVIKKYFITKVHNNLLNFSDILLYSYLLLFYDKNLREKYKEKFKYIFVDEFQDTNIIQFETLKLIFNENNYFLVGDPYQSIYKFLGANIENIINISNDKTTNTIQLNINYRSTQNIVELTNDLTELFEYKIPHYERCKSGNTEYENKKIKICEYVYQEDEIIKDIKEKIKEGIPKKEITIISRNNFETAHLEQKLLSERIYYQKLSGKGFYEMQEIEIALSILKFMIYENDIFAFQKLAIFYPKIGEKTLSKLVSDYLKDTREYRKTFNITTYIENNVKNKNVLKLIEEFKKHKNISFKNYKEILILLNIEEQLIEKATTTKRKKEIKQNISTINEEIQKLFEFKSLDKIKNFLEDTSLNNKKEKSNKENLINITTAHSAKGLEWRCVYILNAEDGKFPSTRSLKKVEEIEEEKRLFYVAVSRAKDNLSIYSAEKINMFLSDIKYKRYIDLILGTPKKSYKFFN